MTTSTDKELLELAAKAAGISGEWGEAYKSIHVDTSPLRNFVLWNPLTDDGDALRLAVKLDLSIFFSRKHIDVSMEAHGLGEICETFTTFKEVATRRAIVIAAAEIGRNTQ
jgi:hypothetical protein